MALIKLLGMVPLLAWFSWHSAHELAERWANEPEYAQGYFVVAFAVILSWLRRAQLPGGKLNGSWWGVWTIALAIAMRLQGPILVTVPLELASLMVCLAGCCLALGGFKLLHWAAPAVLLLLLLLPLPTRMEETVASRLRPAAIDASAYVMQTLGLPAVAERNLILVDESDAQVVEVGSGLGTIITLLAMTWTVVLVARRELWQKVVILLSAVPIGLAINVVRTILTGVVFEVWGTSAAELFFRHLAGWVTLPLAMAILWLECCILGNLIHEMDMSVRPLRSFGLIQPVRHRDGSAKTS
jgi:exosortase